MSSSSKRFSATICLFLCLELFDERVHFLEACFPELAIALEPIVQAQERVGAQFVEPLLGASLHADEPRLFQHPQMFGHLRLIELQTRADVVHVARARAKELDDAKAIGFCQRRECLDHVV